MALANGADVPSLQRNTAAQLDLSAQQIERWATQRTWSRVPRSPEALVDSVRQLLDMRRTVDQALEESLARRTEFAQKPTGDARREQVRTYLQMAARLIDLSGRLRYLVRDAIDNATTELSTATQQLDALVDLLIERKSQIGADRLAYVLFDPPAAENLQPFPDATKRRVLELITATRPADLIDELAEYVALDGTPADLRFAAAEAIRAIGLPQDPLPDQDPTLPQPEITAAKLLEIVRAIDASMLDETVRPRRDELITWLDARATRGVDEHEYQIGTCAVRAGDWLLMRNPSPYNRFTDHSPGLFTHVGVVTATRDEQGIRRFVIADLPERGDRIPATNVDIFLRRTLHYVFLRHSDAEVARQLGDAARELIGQESQFDLQFRTDRVLALQGQPLTGRPVHTYCAGFLLLCAQQTKAPWREFFPIVEQPASSRCLDNLGKLGLSIGRDFLSPTGALFSEKLEIVGRCEPMYEPTREVQDAVFDAFARGMIERRLTPNPDAYQSLREKLGTMSRRNRTLAKALARANNVSENTDLESAAKAAAVIETLDEIADRAAREFIAARSAITADMNDGHTREELAEIRKYRKLHASLAAAWSAERLTPSELRTALVEYYRRQGERQLEERFFR